MTTETLRADAVLANNGCVTPANAQGAPDAAWTGNTGSTSWDCRWSVGNPVDALTSGFTTHSAAVFVRRESAGGSDPTIAIELWSAGTLVRELVAASVVASASGESKSGNFTTAEAGPGADLEVHAVIVGGGGSPANRRNAQIDYFTITVDTTAGAPPITGNINATAANATSDLNGTNVLNRAYDQAGFRGRNDNGNETTATWKAAENTGWTQAVDENFRFRAVVDETASGTGLAVTAFKLQYNLNGVGWNDVNDLSSVVRTTLSPNVANNAATTRQLTSGTGTFVAGAFDENNGAAASANTIESGELTEMEYCAQIRSADVVNNDTIQLRIVEEVGSVVFAAYSQVPTITVSEAVPPISGTIAASTADATSDINGTASAGGVTGNIAASTADATSSISGTSAAPTFTGNIAATTADATSSITGTSQAPTYTGTIAVALADATSNINGTSSAPGGVTGTISAATADVTANLTGIADPPDIIGTLSAVVADAVANLSGTADAPAITGNFAVILADAMMAEVGTAGHPVANPETVLIGAQGKTTVDPDQGETVLVGVDG